MSREVLTWVIPRWGTTRAKERGEELKNDSFSLPLFLRFGSGNKRGEAPDATNNKCSSFIAACVSQMMGHSTTSALRWNRHHGWRSLVWNFGFPLAVGGQLSCDSMMIFPRPLFPQLTNATHPEWVWTSPF
mgnify:CR=1 FL=1